MRTSSAPVGAGLFNSGLAGYAWAMQAGENSIQVELAISADEYLKLYRGTAKQVVATADDGRVVRFPASCLQPFITHSGIYGCFVLVVDAQHKLLRVERAQH